VADISQFLCYDQIQGISMPDLLTRITIDPNRMHGRPCIRGLRITVADVLDLLATGQSREMILQEYPYLESADIDAVLAFAARQADHPIIAAE
jgi:uncharacterized protein (DUF433 family)